MPPWPLISPPSLSGASVSCPPPALPPTLQRFLLPSLLLTAAREMSPGTCWLKRTRRRHLRALWARDVGMTSGSSTSHFSQGCKHGISSGLA